MRHSAPIAVSTIPACEVTSVHGVEPWGQPIRTDISPVARQPITTDISPVARQSAPQPSLPPPPLSSSSAASTVETIVSQPLKPFQKRARWNTWSQYSGHFLRPPLQELHWSERLESQESKNARTAVQPIGGLRQLASTMSRLPIVREAGSLLFIALRSTLRSSATLQSVLSTIGLKDCTSVGAEVAQAAAQAIRSALGPRVPNFSPTRSLSDVCTPVDVDLLELWRTASMDPDTAVVRWLREGAPAGLLQPIEDCGIFPTYSEEEDPQSMNAEDLCTESAFTNYAGVEDNEDVALEMQRLTDAGFVTQFQAYEDLVKHLGAEAVLSRIGVIERIRNGVVRYRIVIDSKRSSVSAATRRFQRTLLPRVLDVVYDGLDLLAAHRAANPGVPAELEFLIAR